MTVQESGRATADPSPPFIFASVAMDEFHFRLAFTALCSFAFTLVHWH